MKFGHYLFFFFFMFFFFLLFFLFYSFFSFFYSFFFLFFFLFFSFFSFFFVGSRPLLFLLISIHRALLLCCVFTWPLLEDLPVGLASAPLPPIPTTFGRPQVLRGGLLSFSGWRFGRPGLGDPLRLAHEARHAPVICFAVLQPPLRVEVLQRGGGRAIHCWLGRCSQELQVLLHHRTNLSLHCPSQPPAFSLGQMSRS